ncbi:MAG: single-stranded DNA-binding protein [Proteobacteria bacterium]|nr:single-stranded DNA-binding protein [Pseudomonadota bacterium]
MLNKVQLIGRVGQEPEQKILSSGNTLVNISLATNERWKDKSGNTQEKTSWHRITLWGGQANFVAQYVRKGDLLYIEGRIDYQEWDKNGVKQYSTSIIAGSVQKLSWDKKQNQENQTQQSEWNPEKSPQTDGSWNTNPGGSQGTPPDRPPMKPDSPKPIFGNVSPVDDLLEDDIPF